MLLHVYHSLPTTPCLPLLCVLHLLICLTQVSANGDPNFKCLTWSSNFIETSKMLFNRGDRSWRDIVKFRSWRRNDFGTSKSSLRDKRIVSFQNFFLMFTENISCNAKTDQWYMQNIYVRFNQKAKLSHSKFLYGSSFKTKLLTRKYAFFLMLGLSFTKRKHRYLERTPPPIERNNEVTLKTKQDLIRLVVNATLEKKSHFI